MSYETDCQPPPHDAYPGAYICLLGHFVSMTPSDSDGAVKRFPSPYRTPMDPPKDFQASIGLRWIRQKISKPLSDSDGHAKKIQASIGLRWTRQKISKPPSDSDGAAKKIPSLYRTPMDKM